MTLFLHSLLALLVTARSCPYDNLSETTFSDPRYRYENFLPLMDCNITHIPQGIFKYIPHLHILSLRGNLIAELKNSNFEGLESLDILDLSENRLTALPQDFLHDLPPLKLIIDNNPLAKISGNELTGSNLTKLNIMDNLVPLTLKSRALADMSLLKVVVLKNCSVTSLPGDLFEGSTAVEQLKLSSNRIKTLPADVFANTPSLIYLSLDDNQLSDLAPVNFATLHNLRVLHLENNEISELNPCIFSSLTKLETLLLRENRLRVVSPDAFPVSLEILSLGNELTTLETRVLPALTELYLDNNSFSSVPQHWSDTLPALRRLDMSNNKFTQLSTSDMAVFSHYPEARINMSTNQILAVLMKQSEVPHILLEGAPLRCDCLMHELATYIHKNSNKVQDAICADPAALKGIKLTEVSLIDLVCLLDPCPDTCTCVVRPETKALEVECREQLTAEQFTDLENLRQQHYSDMTQNTTISYLVQ